MTKLKALRNISYNGMLKVGDVFEEASEKNVAYLTKRKLAEVIEQEEPEDVETEDVEVEVEDEDEFLDEDVSFDEEPEDESVELDEAELDAADTHAKLDAIQEKLGLAGLPGKDKLNLTQRKAKIRSELSKDAE